MYFLMINVSLLELQKKNSDAQVQSVAGGHRDSDNFEMWGRDSPKGKSLYRRYVSSSFYCQFMISRIGVLSGSGYGGDRVKPKLRIAWIPLLNTIHTLSNENKSTIFQQFSLSFAMSNLSLISLWHQLKVISTQACKLYDCERLRPWENFVPCENHYFYNLIGVNIHDRLAENPRKSHRWWQFS